MLRLLGFVVVIAGAVYLAGYFKTDRIETTVDIAASPEDVWAVLTDLPGYSDWNPFITEASGEIRTGAQLRIELAPIGDEDAMTFEPTVQAVSENQSFSWLGQVYVPGIFDGNHQFVLEATETGTRLTQREEFRGLMLYLTDIARYEPSFAAMNAALKEKAEAMAAAKMPAAPMPAETPTMMAPENSMMAPEAPTTGDAMAPENSMMSSEPMSGGAMMSGEQPVTGGETMSGEQPMNGEAMTPQGGETMTPEPAPAAQ